MVLWLASHEQARCDKLALVLLVVADDEVWQAADVVEQAEPAIVLEPMLGLVLMVALMVNVKVFKVEVRETLSLLWLLLLPKEAEQEMERPARLHGGYAVVKATTRAGPAWYLRE
jgi:hypothetical protein